MITRWSVLSGTLAALVPSLASAHPGHGLSDGWSLFHFVSEPLHGGAGILLAAGVLVAFAWIRRTSRSR